MIRRFPMRARPAGRRLIVAILAACLLPLAAGAATARQDEAPAFDPAAFGLGLELIVEGLSSPVQIVDAADGSGRFFLVEKTGTIRILRDGSVGDAPFLDLSDRVSGRSEQGLLSMALHPAFTENGVFFVYYTDVDGNTRVVRYALDGGDSDRADPDSAQELLFVEQPYPNHNGGLLLFGPDGYLYVGLGDGGSGGDPEGNAQNLGTLLGAILRIDVDNTSGELPYAIPDDNPFVGRDGARGEIWAYGLRNPWRFSFDRETGNLWVTDVGQNELEEVNVAPGNPGGLNYGWPILEADRCYESSQCDASGFTMPVAVYDHQFGCSVTGGYVYRGGAIPSLRGVYLYADYCSGLLWGLGQDAEGEWVASDPIETGLNVSSFGEDASGELYVVDLNGRVYRVVAPA